VTVKVLFFAGLRETLGRDGVQCELPAEVVTVGDLRAHLARQEDPWPVLATVKNLRAAVNQTMVAMNAPVRDGDEVAFFPPVTGG